MFRCDNSVFNAVWESLHVMASWGVSAAKSCTQKEEEKQKEPNQDMTF